MLLRNTDRFLGGAPAPIDTRRPERTDESVVLGATVLDLLVVEYLADVGTVDEFSDHTDQ